MLLEKIQLEPDERVLSQVRRHWFVIVSNIFLLAMTAMLPIPLLFLGQGILSNYVSLPMHLGDYWTWLLFFQSVLAMVVWFVIFNVWTNYYLDVLTITDRRAILINQRGFFRRHVTSFRLERLQDLEIEINGVIATLLDYGDLHAETAGHAEEEFTARSLPKPRELKGLILKAADNRIPSTENHANL
ncbi:MAG: PH domain-containing protein [Candidatus Paceibacterota bacterium]